MKNILVFNHTFFPLSETFVHKQIIGLSKKFNICLLSYKFINEDIFPTKCKKYNIKYYTNFIDRISSYVLKNVFRMDMYLSIVTNCKVKNILKNNEIDIIHAHFGSSALSILPIARKLKIPLVVTFHGIDASPASLKNLKYKKNLYHLFEYAVAIVIVSPHMINTLELKKWANKVHIIPYGIDHTEFKKIDLPTPTSNLKLNILHSGRLVGKKGVPDLIKVFIDLCEKYPNISLDIIGGGNEKEKCEAIIHNSVYGNRIKLWGAQPQSVIKDVMNVSDLFILNSRTDESGDMEGLPVSILEAMSMTMPVISTYHAGISQAIVNGYNGLLVSEKDNTALFSAIESLIIDKQKRIELGMNARKTILEKFEIKSMQNEILNIFEKI